MYESMSSYRHTLFIVYASKGPHDAAFVSPSGVKGATDVIYRYISVFYQRCNHNVSVQVQLATNAVLTSLMQNLSSPPVTSARVAP